MPSCLVSYGGYKTQIFCRVNNFFLWLFLCLAALCRPVWFPMGDIKHKYFGVEIILSCGALCCPAWFSMGDICTCTCKTQIFCRVNNFVLLGFLWGIYVHAHVYMCTYVCMHACMYTYYIYMYVYIYIYIHTYACMYTYTCMHKCICM